MEALSTKTLELRAESSGPGNHRLFYGDYAYYLDRIERESAEGEASDLRSVDRRSVASGVNSNTAVSGGGKGGSGTVGMNGNGKTNGDTVGINDDDAGSITVGVNGTGKADNSTAGINRDADTDSVTAGPGGFAVPGGAGTPASFGSAGDYALSGGLAAPLPKSILIKAGGGVPLGAAESREAAKQRQTMIRRLERQEAEILAELEALEAEKAALESELGKPEVYRNGEKARAVKAQLDGVAAAVERKSREWEAKAGELEAARTE
jgi:hypothetical protein